MLNFSTHDIQFRKHVAEQSASFREVLCIISLFDISILKVADVKCEMRARLQKLCFRVALFPLDYQEPYDICEGNSEK